MGWGCATSAATSPVTLRTVEGELAVFTQADELYLARGAEVNPRRPIFTGDVFEGVAIAGIQDGHGSAMVISQPCTMRQGPRMRPHMLAIAVQERTPLRPDRWVRCYKEYPLPELDGESSSHAAHFPLMGRIETADLKLDRRVACLSDTGVDLLHQRLVWNMTRVQLRLQDIRPFTRPFFDEAELLEEWRDLLCEAGLTEDEATERFDSFMKLDDRRERLGDGNYAAQVRRECEQEARRQLAERSA